MNRIIDFLLGRRSEKAPSPIHWQAYDTPSMKRGWYFWDETWSDAYGPYETKKLARIMLDGYCRDVLGC